MTCASCGSSTIDVFHPTLSRLPVDDIQEEGMQRRNRDAPRKRPTRTRKLSRRRLVLKQPKLHDGTILLVGAVKRLLKRKPTKQPKLHAKRKRNVD